MMTAVIIYLSIGLIISISARHLIGDRYPYITEPWMLHTVVIFLWLPAAVAVLVDIGRKR